MKFRHPRMIGILVSITLTLLLIDACLYHIDPLGIVASTYDNHAFHAVMQADSTGYRLQTGTHRLHGYTVTILEDGSRAVPDTNTNADCTIATIGDSMTYGQGVNDAETWVNILAILFPDVHFINPARPDYSAPNVLALKTAYRADGYLWLLIGNDALEAYQYRAVYPAHPYPPATGLYRDWLMSRLQGTQQRERIENLTTYWQAVKTILDANTLTIGFLNDALTMNTAMQYPVVLIAPYTGFVSPVDRHPNAQGQQQIAGVMYPYLIPFIEAVCNG